MKIRPVILFSALLVLVIVLSGCGSSPTPTPAPKPTTVVPPTVPPTQPPPTPQPTAVPPTATPLPPTPTPIPPQVTTKQQVNLRQGPGTQFTVAGKMPINTSAVIVGKNEDGKWLQVAFPDATHPAWIATSFVTVTGTIDLLPVVAVAVPPTPTAGKPAPTKAAVAPTQSFPAPRGGLGYVSFDASQATYILNNLTVDTHATSGFTSIGPTPFDVDRSTNAAPFGFSPDGTRVAFVFGQLGSANKLRVNQYSGNFDTYRDLVSYQGISSPSWSPDSRMIAYIGMENDYKTQFIYAVNVGDGKQAYSPFAARYDQARSIGEVFRGVSWGKTHILFVSNLTGAFEIWRLNGDLSGPVQLTTDKRENGSPAMSPDGKQFAYYSKQVDGTYQIMVAPMEDPTKARKLTNAGSNWTPVWSPDGNWIAFASNRSGRRDVWVMDKNGGNVRLLSDKSSAEAFLPGAWR